MPLRASKMNGFILGFQRFVWCPKWTPESNNSFTPILIIFPLVKNSPERTIPRNTGLMFNVVVVPCPLSANKRIHSMRNEPFFPPPIPAKGTRKVSEKRQVATANFQRGQGKRKV